MIRIVCFWGLFLLIGWLFGEPVLEAVVSPFVSCGPELCLDRTLYALAAAFAYAVVTLWASIVLAQRTCKPAKPPMLFAAVLTMLILAAPAHAADGPGLFTLLSFGDLGWGDELMAGLWVTIRLAVTAYITGTILGLGLALLGRAGPIGARIVLGFNAVIRGVPEILILLLLYYGGGRLIEPLLATVLAPEMVTAAASFMAGQLALGVVSAAYQGEVLRGAINSVPHGQREAGLALGLSRSRIFFRIVMPQSLRLALPGLGNLWLVMLKDTAIIAVIGANDLLRQAQFAIATTKQPFTFYMAVAVIYLVLTALSELVLRRLERRAEAGVRRGVATP